MKELELSDMLVELRRELQNAQCKAEKESLKFKLEDLEVEVSFVISKEGTAGGKAKFLVFEAELGGKTAAQTVHKIKLKMRPELEGGGEVKIASAKTKQPE